MVSLVYLLRQLFSPNSFCTDSMIENPMNPFFFFFFFLVKEKNKKEIIFFVTFFIIVSETMRNIRVAFSQKK